MFRVYGKSNCPYCVKAVSLLQGDSIEYEYYDISGNKELIDNFKSQGFTTVPQIWFNDEHIGGYDDLVKFIDK
ncbi:MAG: glutaredoxin [Haliea sp.]|uniref:glutaredoxin domain-containing protein n=1 Tax=Haliea sp. TaxID=1932666 RepID=UPI000C554B1D|nr:glutaredoxin domain-containing protein [Haliea sp.]MBM68200.1 glutaredoxin [Haliea sp.]|tara:strand:+ start:1708 stop:1926 length:219 start_codon:yes stop_codon:yes gene_type:complete